MLLSWVRHDLEKSKKPGSTQFKNQSIIIIIIIIIIVRTVVFSPKRVNKIFFFLVCLASKNCAS
jgi:hypothetical protein